MRELFGHVGFSGLKMGRRGRKREEFSWENGVGVDIDAARWIWL